MPHGITPAQRDWVLHSLRRYWPTNRELAAALPVPWSRRPDTPLPPTLVAVALPHWAARWGVVLEHSTGQQPALLVPEQALAPAAPDTEPWQNVDWWRAAFWFLAGVAEQAGEERAGPVHSYALRLRGWDGRMWDRAWVNRMALFLRAWAARENGADEDALFGPRPQGRVHLTHDVDAVAKTLPVRIKQSAFHGFNCLRSLFLGQPGRAARYWAKGLGFLLRPGDYLHLERIRELEAARGLTGVFHVYGGPGGYGRGPKTVLLDPMYRADRDPLNAALRALAGQGWTVGLHPSFAAWRDPERMGQEKRFLEQALDAEVTHCRQHWLRFSWRETWRAQARAGLSLDATLGFNDRPGFRNGAALALNPWHMDQDAPLAITALPLVAMDSHFFDYQAHASDEQRLAALMGWVDEILAVGGEGSVCWHQRVWSKDYGWGGVYEALLDRLAG